MSSDFNNETIETAINTGDLDIIAGSNKKIRKKCLRQSLGLVQPPATSVSNPTRLQEAMAEFIGTFIIVQVGCGTVCAQIFRDAQMGLWQVVAVWAIGVTLAISATATVSGAHLNPAITFSMALLRDFDWKKVPIYVMAQLLGAIVAAATNLALYHDSISAFEAEKGINRGSEESIESAKAFGEYWSVSSAGTAFLAEAYGTAFLAFVIFSLTNTRNDISKTSSFLIPPFIGMTVAAMMSILAPLTQGGLNPARDFGPRIIAAMAGWEKVAMKGWWLYIIAPMVGAPIGALLSDRFLYPPE